MRPSAEAAALNTSASLQDLGTRIYADCSAAGYGLAACRAVQTGIATSHAGNLARRAGALCVRLGECRAGLSMDASCVLTANVTDAIVADNITPAITGNSSVSNATSSSMAAAPLRITGALDTCTVEGVSGGMRVAGTYRFGAGMTAVLPCP